ncbi:MAG: prepilin peptidase [Myxococcaceae bacterium]
MTPPPLTFALWAVLGVALLASVITDLASHRILDVVTYPAMALSLGLRFWRGGIGDLEGGLLSGLAAGVGAAALFAVLAWRGRGFGWGDVKLMGAVGAAMGYPLVLAALVFISLVGALQAVVTLVWQGAVWETLSAQAARFAAKARLLKARAPAAAHPRHIPYGIAIALGSFWAMWWEHSNIQ